MKQSIVWKCAVTVAVAQLLNFVILSSLAITAEIGPVYREWTRYTVDSLRGHHQVLSDVVRNNGVDSAQSVAAQLSLADLEHVVVVEKPGWLAQEYLGLPGSDWSDFVEQADGPRRFNGQLRWMSETQFLDNGRPRRAIILSSARWPVARAARNHPVGASIWILGGLGLSAIVGGLVASWFTKPILQLRTSISRFASGELESRPAARLQARGDEIGQLAREMADMEARIASLVNAQKELLDHVAHELRSPLARINVAVELEEKRVRADGADNPSEETDYLAKIRSESVRLSDMVDQLLQLSALEHRVDDIHETEISLNSIVREVAEDCEFEAQTVGRHVLSRMDDDIRASGNAELLRSAIENIVRNGIRHTPPGSTVNIDLHAPAEAYADARIVIRDHGPGVPDEDLKRLFKPFSVIDEQNKPDGSGVGLGLALAERAVRAHGGKIDAQNHPEGGLQLVIELPTLLSRLGSDAGSGTATGRQGSPIP